MSLRRSFLPFVVLAAKLCVLAALMGAISCSRADNEASGDEHEHQDEHGEHEDGVVELTPEAAAHAGIRTARVEERVLAGEIETTGQVGFDRDRLAHVSPRIPGRVHRVEARLGQQVSSGETLVEIDSIELGKAKAEFLRAKAKEELARGIWDRERKLFADRISSEQEVLVAEAERREAATALHTAEETLHLYGLSQARIDTLRYDDPQASIFRLRAPFAGTIVERHATLGELVTPERSLFTLADLGAVWIWIDVYQRDLGRVHLDDGARIRVDAYPGEVFSGVVSYLSAQVDVKTRTVRARVDVANPESKLRPGMFVEVELADPHADGGLGLRETTRAVPQSAVARDGDELVVFVVTGANRFERREIRAGRRAGGWVELVDGPELGVEVVVEGSFLLKSAAAKESMGAGHHH